MTRAPGAARAARRVYALGPRHRRRAGRGARPTWTAAPRAGPSWPPSRPLRDRLADVDPDRLDEVPAPPPGLGDRVLAGIAAEQRPTAGQARPRARRRWVAAVAAAGIAAAGVRGGLAGRAGARPRPPLEAVAVAGRRRPTSPRPPTVVPHTWGMEISLHGEGFTAGEVYRVHGHRGGGAHGARRGVPRRRPGASWTATSTARCCARTPPGSRSSTAAARWWSPRCSDRGPGERTGGGRRIPRGQRTTEHRSQTTIPASDDPHRHTLRRAAVVAGAAGALALAARRPGVRRDPRSPSPTRSPACSPPMATPDMVINNDGVATPGEPGASGTFTLPDQLRRPRSSATTSRLTGVTPPYQSPAKTATHIHEARRRSGRPAADRVPQPRGRRHRHAGSSGCLQGPFTTGLWPTAPTPGPGFSLDQIEADPSAFFTDTHTSAFAAGAVRGQLVQIPVGGVRPAPAATAAASRPRPPSTAPAARRRRGAAGRRRCRGPARRAAAVTPRGLRPARAGRRAALALSACAGTAEPAAARRGHPQHPPRTVADPAAPACAGPAPGPGRRCPCRPSADPGAGHRAAPRSASGSPDGTAEVPVDFDDVGWFTPGGRARRPGPDGADGPRRLHAPAPRSSTAARPRPRETPWSSPSPTARWPPTGRPAPSRSPRTTFPTAAVFGATADDVLRLITCTGELRRRRAQLHRQPGRDGDPHRLSRVARRGERPLDPVPRCLRACRQRLRGVPPAAAGPRGLAGAHRPVLEPHRLRLLDRPGLRRPGRRRGGRRHRGPRRAGQLRRRALGLPRVRRHRAGRRRRRRPGAGRQPGRASTAATR